MSTTCCGVNHVWGDHNFLVCDYCKIEVDHFRDADNSIAMDKFHKWKSKHRHDGEPCPGQSQKGFRTISQEEALSDT
jgi:hypothetical protein